MEERLDKILIQRKLVTTRTRAEKIIREVGVKVDGKLITKSGKKVPVDCIIEMVEEEIPWVSRGALKLIEALNEWNPEIENGIFMDIGASTGGFTQVLLDRKAAKVYCVDVGTAQLHEKVKDNDKTVNLEKTHVRELTPKLIQNPIDGCVIDVSFISLEKILPFIHSFIKDGGWIVALVKPQFEVGKNNVGKGGIVKDTKLFKDVIENVKKWGELNNLVYQEHISSPILGGDGNREFLMYLKKES
ncbi:MAG: 23S rRNA (cytidine1920-2'-O)/16S rRNA (cytidine1409-2'-O)-methyltransferase [Crocinitomicaceae bacterium]|jgi:23S rRNA (cytidine1920-2'-O)/16S rRNA (cytidine1409-2'-O)-methyltransferase